MTKNYSYLILIFTVFLTLVFHVKSDANETIAQLDTTAQEKQTFIQQKDQLFLNLSGQQNNLKLNYAELIQTKTGAESAYYSFFTQNMRCDGLLAKNDLIGNVSSIDNDTCLEAPVVRQAFAYQAFIQKMMLDDLARSRTRVTKNFLDQQSAFNVDVFNEWDIYKKLRAAALQKLTRAQQIYQECIGNNPNATNCTQERNAFQRAQQIYGYFREKQISFGMSTRGPVLYLALRQSDYDYALLYQTSLESIVNDKMFGAMMARNQCLENLQNLRTFANINLKLAANATSKIQAQKQLIDTILSNITNVVQNLQNSTTTMQNLATQLKQSF